MTNYDVAKKLILTGPGGMKCPCCAPPPGSSARRKMLRIARRKADAFHLAEGLEFCYDNVELDSEGEEDLS